MARIIITFTAPLFYFLIFSLYSHQTMSQPHHMHTFCGRLGNFSQPSPYEQNRDALLSTLNTKSSLGTYSNSSIGLTPDKVFGTFLCRGDMDTKSCSECVQTATIEIAKNCTLNKRAVIYYQECMVRYSNISFFSELEFNPFIVQFSSSSFPNPSQYNKTLTEKFSQLLLNVSSFSLVPYFVKDQEVVNQPEGSYELETMVQCSPGLNLTSCIVCLRVEFLRFTTCCDTPSSSYIFASKCLLRYKTSLLSSPSPSQSPISLPPQASPPQSSPPLSLPLSPPQSSPPLSLPLSPPQSSPPLSLPLSPQAPQPKPKTSGSLSVNVIKGNEIFGRVVVAMTALVFALH